MASCKNCLHCELCKRIDYELEYHNKSIKEAEEELPIKCRFFKNKADFQEVKHGEWVYNLTYYESDECNCSLCGQLMTTAKGVRMNYCPNCGAKMDGGKSG